VRSALAAELGGEIRGWQRNMPGEISLTEEWPHAKQIDLNRDRKPMRGLKC
jgi:hypothetical protein